MESVPFAAPALPGADVGSDSPRPNPPHLHERRYFYRGVYGTLVARTSTYEFPTGYSGYHDFPDEKRFFTIGQHPILSLWSEELVETLQSTLESLQWDRFYPIRIGSLWKWNPSGPERALVLMVDVPYNTTDWDTAIEVALRCRNLLRQAKIPDIEVEIREVDRGFLAMDVELERVIEKRGDPSIPSVSSNLQWFSYAHLAPILSNIGYQIAPEDEMGIYYGTMGLHVRLSGRPSEIYGLTCRHVAHRVAKEGGTKAKGYWLPNGDRWRLEDGDEVARHRIVQMCPPELDDIRAGMANDLQYAKQYWRTLSMKQLKYEVEPECRPKLTWKEVRDLEDLNCDVPFAEDVLRLLSQSTLEMAEGRSIGYIAAMPPIEVSPRGFLRDWALIRLDEAKFEGPVTNKVFIGPGDGFFLSGSAARRETESDSCHAFLREKTDNRSKVRLQGIVSLADIHARKSLQVAKYGAKTHLTFGVTNEIKAVIRIPAPDGKRMCAWEWIVVGLQDSRKHPPFSEPGDSGAAVFDFDGRVVGFLGSGFDPSRNMDTEEKEKITKAPPCLWKHHKLDDEELPEDPGKEKDPNVDDDPPEGFRRYIKGTDLSFVTPVDVVFEDIRLETGCDVEII